LPIGLFAPPKLTTILAHYADLDLFIQSDGQDAIDTGGPHPNGGNLLYRQASLHQAGQSLAATYARSTVSNDAPDDIRQLVVSGEGCIAIVYPASSYIQKPRYIRKVESYLIQGVTINLFGYRWNHNNVAFKVWIFEWEGSQDGLKPGVVSELEKIRANLFHLNAEKETARIIMQGVEKRQPVSLEEELPEVSRYLKKKPAKIFRKERFSGPQAAFFGLAMESRDTEVELSPQLKEAVGKFVASNLEAMLKGMKSDENKQTILFITSSPSDLNPFDYGEQFKRIDEALQSGMDRDHFQLLTPKTALERRALKRILSQKTPDFIHFTLHNSTVKGLYFQDAMKNPDPVSVEEFVDYIGLLSKKKRPQAIILSACNSLDHASSVTGFCNFAMGTNDVFPDDAAIIYADSFYQALFDGNDVSFCHDTALLAIKHTKPPFKPIGDHAIYLIPQLIQTK
jgi:hypothetical protein